MILSVEKDIMNSNIKETAQTFSLEKLTIKQLVSLSIDSAEDSAGYYAKCELVRRGTDNIQDRILIKKNCKESLSIVESKLSTNQNDSSLKQKLLTVVSLIDRLHLEWQKQDLVLKIH